MAVAVATAIAVAVGAVSVTAIDARARAPIGIFVCAIHGTTATPTAPDCDSARIKSQPGPCWGGGLYFDSQSSPCFSGAERAPLHARTAGFPPRCGTSICTWSTWTEI